MTKYNYTVINTEGQKLNGTIESGDEQSARDNLSQLGFAILEITEEQATEAKETAGDTAGSPARGTEQEPSAPKFEFTGVDQNGRKVAGTISAATKYDAFKRLVAEYHFAIDTLCSSALSREAREVEKKQGVLDMYQHMKKEQEITDKTKTSDNLNVTEEETAKLIFQNIDEVLKKVDSFLQEFGSLIKPEENNTIQKKSDHLSRMRTSKNLEYVKHLAEDLLEHVQKQEIYLVEQKSNEKIQTFRIDAKRLLNELHREKITPTLRQDIMQKLEKVEESIQKGEVDAELIPWWKRIALKCTEFTKSLLVEPPEITILKEKIRILNGQIWDYWMIWIKEKTIEGRKEIRQTIRNIKAQREELKTHLKEIREKFKQSETLEQEETLSGRILMELRLIVGWFFGCYFTLHIITRYFVRLKIKLQKPFDLLMGTQSEKYLITLYVLLIVYVGLHMISKTSHRKIASSMVVIPVSMILILIVAYNF